jgi:hydrogenase expression/formation protein HypD
MKFVDEYRDGATAQKLAEAIRRTATRPWTLMEVCGGQTHTILKYGLDQLLPDGIELLHGPGCPVCVTPLEMIDKAHAIASRPDVIFCSFGDMLRIPGSRGDFLQLKARGRDIRVLYSPLDAVKLAEAHPDKQVVFFAVGFETTAPANAMAASVAKKRQLANFSLLVSHVRVPPALTFILQAPGNRVQGFLGPGHVCTVMGTHEYEPICAKYLTPIVVTGFEPVDLLEGVLCAVRQLERGEARVENQYARVVRAEGNRASLSLLQEVFEVCDRPWRGIGILPKSGLRLTYEYRAFDAEHRFEVEAISPLEPSACISGQVLRGMKKPTDCPAFGRTCTPQTPLGATMVSSEGACAAYFQYGLRLRPAPRQAGPGRAS